MLGHLLVSTAPSPFLFLFFLLATMLPYPPWRSLFLSVTATTATMSYDVRADGDVSIAQSPNIKEGREESNNDRKILILNYDYMGGWHHYLKAFDASVAVKFNCVAAASRCEFTSDRALIDSADAVLFRGDLDTRTKPRVGDLSYVFLIKYRHPSWPPTNSTL